MAVQRYEIQPNVGGPDWTLHAFMYNTVLQLYLSGWAPLQGITDKPAQAAKDVMGPWPG